ncbi:MAG TPA: hypothetical protein VG675_01140 [Bryobacteraceae bacterium]|nr:hypothetical protein [Bryobacteraceae bacterium]
MVSRRDFLAASVSGLAARAVAAPENTQPTSETQSAVLDVDHAALVSRADLVYEKPVSRSEEGMPVGNGRMGSLVWTSPSALKFQINRADVYPISSSTFSFPMRNADYASSCGFVDIDFVDYGDDVFTPPAFHQHLAVHDAVMTAQGRGVTTRVLAWHEKDVIAVEVEDRRSQPAPVNIDLRMLRYVVQFHFRENWELTRHRQVKVSTRNHDATSQLDIQGGCIILKQEFREGEHYAASAVVIGVLGRRAKPKYVHDSSVRLSAAPGKGRFTILIASAATFDPKQDVVALAQKELDAAAAKGFDQLLAGNRTFWHDFWSKGFIHLHSDDGEADFVEKHYTYFLYVMSSCSRGPYPPRYGGLLWYTNADMRTWGSQHWWNNTATYYAGLAPANRLELLDPMFSMYSGMHDACALAAKQQWGSEGIWIPETLFFDGPEKLPDDIAAEMQELYLVRKPWDQKSVKFTEFAATKNGHNSRWNYQADGKWVDGRYVFTDKGAGPFGHTTHIMATAGKIAFHYWVRFESTQDKEWLREHAYPMLKGTVEFYRHFPNLRKEADGKYHIHHVNHSEWNWNADDTQEELSTIRGITPLLIKASEILNVDADLRPAWRDLLENLAPLPTNEMAGMRAPGEPLLWVTAVHTARAQDRPRVNPGPATAFDLCTLETEDEQVRQITRATYEAGPARGLNEKTDIRVLSNLSTAAANLGRGDHIKIILPNQIRCFTAQGDFCDAVGSGEPIVLANRMTLREGPGATDCQRLGQVTAGLHLALLQSSPPEPGKEPVIRVFGAWPKEWDAEFTLLARGAFLVTAAMRGGKVEFVEFVSKAGSECRLRNPWGDAAVSLFRNGQAAGEASGPLLTFATAKSERIVVVPNGTSPAKFKREVAHRV